MPGLPRGQSAPGRRGDKVLFLSECRLTPWRAGSGGSGSASRLEDEVYRPLAHHCIDADVTIQAFVVESIREKLARESTRT